MEYLPWGNLQGLGELEGEPAINVAGKNVVIIGGGDTGADCLGTALRQGAASITQLEILPRPSEERPSAQPWPTYPMIFRTSSAHEEGGERIFAVNTSEFIGDQGVLTGLKISEVELSDGKFVYLPGTDRVLPADFVLLALGFVGPEKSELIPQLEVDLDERGNIKRADDYSTNIPGVFVCGDAGRGQSLIVWAIAEGRAAAAGVDHFLTGRTLLPAPILPSARPLTI
jgi:glutamate synthase (NADPH/NADH) small chain